MFSKQLKGKYSVRAKCKSCVSEYAKEYYQNNGKAKYQAKKQARAEADNEELIDVPEIIEDIENLEIIEN